MDNTIVGRDARIRRAIIDRFNTIEPGTVIGEGAERQLETCIVDPSGITVMGRGATRVRTAAPPGAPVTF
jgi:glucose-1-phosphate adenylyltransferase